MLHPVQNAAPALPAAPHRAREAGVALHHDWLRNRVAAKTAVAEKRVPRPRAGAPAAAAAAAASTSPAASTLRRGDKLV